MKSTRLRWLVVLIFPLLLAGCGGPTDGKGGTDKLYDIKGKVTAVDLDKPAVTLDHEDIPGLMKAMEMPFKAADAKVLEGIQVGDNVQGKVEKRDTGIVIVKLEKR